MRLGVEVAAREIIVPAGRAWLADLLISTIHAALGTQLEGPVDSHTICRVGPAAASFQEWCGTSAGWPQALDSLVGAAPGAGWRGGHMAHSWQGAGRGPAAAGSVQQAGGCRGLLPGSGCAWQLPTTQQLGPAAGNCPSWWRRHGSFPANGA